MAMFARRVLQRCINESLPYAPQGARRVWVKKLNSSSESAYAATEWEVVTLHTIAQLGTLRHEPLLEGTSKLDIVFEDSTISFGADVTTISDRGLDERNPVRELEERLRVAYQAVGISTGGIALSVTDTSRPMGRAPKGSSIVPPVSEFENLIFNDSFDQWVSTLKARPHQTSKHQIIYRNPLSLILFTYVPGRNGVWCSGYTNYRVTKSLRHNPLHNALAAKASQLKHSGYTGPLGIVVCDGGAEVLRESFSGSISTREVIHEFLRRHTSVDFVVVFALRNFSPATVRQRVESRVYVEKEEPWHRDLSELFSRITAALPQVLQSAENAKNELQFWEGKPHTRLGGFKLSIGMNGIREVRMSTRTLLDVLSGRLPAARLNESFRVGKGKGPFEQLAKAGSSIESSRVERKPDEDEDEIVFTFGRPDPAVSPFTVPEDDMDKP
jgi:hypothetical protein